MASALILDLARFKDCDVVCDRAQIYKRSPQRYEFERLDALVHLDYEAGHSVAYQDVRDDEWWCKGHIPGNPILPGVLMLEAAAQLAAFMECYSRPEFEGFVGYGGVDKCKFRQTVSPPARFWLLCRRLQVRSRRIICEVQGVVDDALIFEANVTGLILPV